MFDHILCKCGDIAVAFSDEGDAKCEDCLFEEMCMLNALNGNKYIDEEE